MIGVPGTAHRLFGALREEGISVILISQGSSEHSICFAVPEVEAERAERVVQRAFDPELREGQIHSVEVNRGCSILAVVGDGMAGAHGVAAQVFSALGQGERERARHRAGCLRAQHLRGDRRSRQRPRAACGAFELLSLGAHDLDRPDRPGPRRRRAARPGRLAGRAPAARLQARPARARDRGIEAHAPRGGADRPRALARRLRSRRRSARLRALRRSRARRAVPARGDHRLQCQRGGGEPLRQVAVVGHPRRHAQQEGQQRGLWRLPARAGRAPRGRHPLPLRGHGGRRPAGDPDAARPARDR